MKDIDEIKDILMKLVNKSQNEKFNKNLIIFLFKNVKKNEPNFGFLS